MPKKLDKPGVIVIEGHVQGLSNTRALGENDIPVIVVDKNNCLARYSKYCKLFRKCPDFQLDQFVEFLVRLGIELGLQGWTLMPSNDHAVFNISKNREKLGEIYKIVIPGTDIIENIYNKEKLINKANEANVPVPMSWFPENLGKQFVRSMNFPLLVKGRIGLTFYKKTGRKAFLVHSEVELNDLLVKLISKAKPEEFFFQELIPSGKDKTISFTAFAREGEILTSWMGTKVREHPIRFGTSTYSRSIEEPEILPLAAGILKMLRYTGICEIEFLRDERDGVFKLIEINARTWLWVGLARKCGVDYANILYNYLNGIHTEYPSNYRTDKEWIHYISDFPFSIAGIIKGNYKPADIVSSYMRFPMPAVFDRSDILPSIAEVLMLPYLILNR
jgi:D-aspartate ligase